MTKIFSVSCSDELWHQIREKGISKSRCFREGAVRILNGSTNTEQKIQEIVEENESMAENIKRLSRRIAEQQILIEEKHNGK